MEDTIDTSVRGIQVKDWTLFKEWCGERGVSVNFALVELISAEAARYNSTKEERLKDGTVRTYLFELKREIADLESFKRDVILPCGPSIIGVDLAENTLTVRVTTLYGAYPPEAVFVRALKSGKFID